MLEDFCVTQNSSNMFRQRSVQIDNPRDPIRGIFRDVPTCPSSLCPSNGTCSTSEQVDHLHTSPYCSCHQECLVYGTCCKSFETTCMPVQYPMETTSIRGYHMACDYIINDGLYRWFYVVTKCPETFLNMTVLGLCEEEPTQLQQVHYVIADGLLYKNKFCAMCHGVILEQAQSVGLQMICLGDFMRSFPHDIDRVSEQYVFSAIVDGHCYPSVSKENLKNVPQCNSKVIQSCSLTLPQTTSTIEQICKSYSAIVKHTTSKIIYKNLHCAYCNGVKSSKFTCLDELEIPRIGARLDGVLSFAMLMDFSGEVAVQLTSTRLCDDHRELTNLEDNSCLSLKCHKSFYLYRDHQCLPFDNSRFAEVSSDSDNGVEIWVEYQNIYKFSQIVIAQLFQQLLPKHFPDQVGQSHISNKSCSSDIINAAHECFCLICNAETSKASFLYHALTRNISGLAYEMMESAVLKAIHIIPNSEAPKSNNSHIQKFMVDGAKLVTDQFYTTLKVLHSDLQHFMRVYLPQYSFSLPINQVAVRLSIKNFDVISKLSRSVSATFYMTECPFKQTEGNISGNCLELLQMGPHDMKGPHILISAAFNSLSLLCLLLCLLPCLLSQTLGVSFGPHLNSFLICALLAHLSALLGYLPVWRPVMCLLLGILQMYFWAGLMTWINVLVFSLHETCKQSVSFHYKPACRKQELLYSIYAWGIPLVVILTVAAVRALGVIHIWTSDTCRLMGDSIWEIAVGSFIVLITSGSLIPLIIIRKSMKKMTLGSSQSAFANNRNKFSSCLKLCLISSTSCLAYFLSHAANETLNQLLLYFANISGVLICTSCMLNKNSFQWLRASCKMFNWVDLSSCLLEKLKK